MPTFSYTVKRTGDLSRDSSVNWALEGTVVTGKPPLVTSVGAPYPRSQSWEQLTFTGPATRVLESGDQHPTSPYADGSICDLTNDAGNPSAADASTMMVVRIADPTGTWPAGLTFTERAKFGLGPTARPGGANQIQNLKSHAVVCLPNNRVVVYYYRLTETNGRFYSCCMVSADDGVTFEAVPAVGTHLFSLGAGTENFQPRGIIQASPAYGAVGNPPDTELNRGYFYIAGNDVSQGGTRNPTTAVTDGMIYLCRYKHAGVSSSVVGADLRTRGRYSFFTGLDANGAPTWTANGGLKTAAGVTPIFRNMVGNVATRTGYFWQCHWHPAIQQWIATWIPQGSLNGVSIAHAPSLWNNSWQMLAHNVPIAGVAANEYGHFLAASCPAAWSNASNLGIGLSTYDETATGTVDKGDDLILSKSSSLVVLSSGSGDLADNQARSGVLTWLANDATSRKITVNTVGNATKQVNRDCTVRLSGAVNGTITGAVATTTIVDDDP